MSFRPRRYPRTTAGAPQRAPAVGREISSSVPLAPLHQFRSSTSGRKGILCPVGENVNFHGLPLPPLKVFPEGLPQIRGTISCHGFVRDALQGCTERGLQIRESCVCDNGLKFSPAGKARKTSEVISRLEPRITSLSVLLQGAGKGAGKKGLGAGYLQRGGELCRGLASPR